MSNTSRTSCVPADQRSLITAYSIQGIYGSASVILYILNIWALRSNRNSLDRTFSRFYVISAILSIVYFLDHFCIRRLVKLGFWCSDILHIFSQPTYILNPYKSIASYCPVAILVLHYCISLHRLTIVIFPMKAHAKWDLWFFPISITALLIPLIFMWFMLPCRSYAKLDPEGGLDIEYKKIFEISSSFWSAMAAVLFGVSTLINTLLIVCILINLRVRQISSQEVSLILFEVLMSITTLLYAVIQALLYYSIYIAKDNSLKSQVIGYRTWIIDVFILPQAWTLLFLSKTVRRHIRQLLSKSIFGSSTTVVMIVPTIAVTSSKSCMAR